MLNSLVPSKSRVLSFILASRTHAYAYVYVPKAACSTTKLALWIAERELSPAVGPIDQPMSIHARQYSDDSPWLTPASADYQALLDQKFLAPIFLFSFVRNPYSRVYSRYRNKILGIGKGVDRIDYFPELGWRRSSPPSFEDFLKIIRDQDPLLRNEHRRTITDLICFDEVSYDKIYKIESFSKDFAELLPQIFPTKLGPACELVHINDTRSSEHRQSAYTAKAIDIAKDIYEKDFTNFDYFADVDAADPQHTSL
jgi:hypothetical protein